MNPFDFLKYEEPDLEKFKRMQELRKAFEAARTGNYKSVPGNENYSETQMQWFPKFKEFEDYEKYLADRASEVGVQPEVSQAASQAMPEPNQLSKVCIWRSVEDEYYDTTCKHSIYFDDGYLEDKPDYKYCPYCGKPIKDKEIDHEQS